MDKPITRKEMYYSNLLGNQDITIPEPITREEFYLAELCKQGMGDGGITEEDADAKYALKEDTVITGSFSQNRKAGTTVGENSHAEGYDTTASSAYSHAEGYLTTASSYYSHAEGYNTKASASGSHAEGGQTTSSSYYSHAEGYKTTASAYCSHAEGQQTKALGDASHAEGVSTIASRMSQHVEGEFNIEDTEGENISAKGKYIHIAGNGTSSKASNAHTLDWEGNAEFAGDVTANGCGGSAPISLVELNNRLKALEDKVGSIVDGNEVAY